ncbi:MAG TPA: hypothetical protein VM029_19670 [Opitutaceae bacterium]|nr:hypothetical protein [Opitutaceae bacterium]
MRRLTLILSDLYLPADAARESFPATLDLPALEWLLRFAREPRAIADWRRWVAREIKAGELADLPVAHTCALAAALPPRGAWIATPVSLEARLNHVRLHDRGLLHLELPERQTLQREFSHVFGHSMALSGGVHSPFVLSGGPDADIPTQDPARLLDSDISRALPSASGAAGELRRLGTEIEMWLHGSSVNAEREKTGRARVSALWLWGGGACRTEVRGTPERPAVRLFGDDIYVHALRGLLGTRATEPMPCRFAELRDGPPTFVELAPMSGSRPESLAELELNWFAPARDALSAGKLESLRLVANDRLFEIAPRAGLRFWRRRRGWLESLGRAARMTEA